MDKIKYLKRTTKGWSYTPPAEAIRAGVVRGRVYNDGRVARGEARKMNEIVELWKKGKLVGCNLVKSSTLNQVASHYMNTSHYNNLSPATRKSYKYLFNCVVDTFGDIPIKNINVAKCQASYDEWMKRGPQYAQPLVRGLSVLFSHAMAHEVVVRNPMASVKKTTHKPTTRVWTKKQVDKFVETAFSDWKYRNIGILVALAYEYAQRPMDIATLKWTDIDFEEEVITITQTKRGATVYLPIDPEIKRLLLQQKETFGFQEWVIPHMRPSDGAYRPMTGKLVSSITKEVVALAGLPEDLYVGKLRNTAINEMVEAGVDSTAIMSVSGHMNISSLNPYLKHTLGNATHALNKRKNK